MNPNSPAHYQTTQPPTVLNTYCKCSLSGNSTWRFNIESYNSLLYFAAQGKFSLCPSNFIGVSLSEKPIDFYLSVALVRPYLN